MGGTSEVLSTMPTPHAPPPKIQTSAVTCHTLLRDGCTNTRTISSSDEMPTCFEPGPMTLHHVDRLNDDADTETSAPRGVTWTHINMSSLADHYAPNIATWSPRGNVVKAAGRIVFVAVTTSMSRLISAASNHPCCSHSRLHLHILRAWSCPLHAYHTRGCDCCLLRITAACMLRRPAHTHKHTHTHMCTEYSPRHPASCLSHIRTARIPCTHTHSASLFETLWLSQDCRKSCTNTHTHAPTLHVYSTHCTHTTTTYAHKPHTPVHTHATHRHTHT